MIRREWSSTAVTPSRVAGREEERHHPVRERRDAGRQVGERGMEIPPECSGALHPHDAARRARREHRPADVEGEIELRVSAHRRLVGVADRRLGGRDRHQSREANEPGGPGEQADEARPAQAEVRAHASARPLADREHDEGRDERDRHECCPRGQEDDLCERRHRLRIPLRPRGRVRSGCEGSRRSDVVDRSIPRGEPGSSFSRSWPRAAPRDRALQWRSPDLRAPPATNAASAFLSCVSRCGPALEAASVRMTPSTTSALARSGPPRRDARSRSRVSIASNRARVCGYAVPGMTSARPAR